MIINMLYMLLPIILPTPISIWPFRIASIDVMSSGNDVPIAITVTPMIISGIWNASAMATALSTVSMAPTYNRPTPMPSKPKDLRLDCFGFEESVSGCTSRRDLLIVYIVNPPSVNINIMPSTCDISPSIDSTTNKTEKPTIIGTSRRIVWRLITSVTSNVDTPITSPILAILLPTIFPSIISPWSPAAAILAASSGVDVPYATTVMPITKLDMPMRLAILSPPLTRQLPP